MNAVSVLQLIAIDFMNGCYFMQIRIQTIFFLLLLLPRIGKCILNIYVMDCFLRPFYDGHKSQNTSKKIHLNGQTREIHTKNCDKPKPQTNNVVFLAYLLPWAHFYHFFFKFIFEYKLLHASSSVRYVCRCCYIFFYRR